MRIILLTFFCCLFSLSPHAQEENTQAILPPPQLANYFNHKDAVISINVTALGMRYIQSDVTTTAKWFMPATMAAVFFGRLQQLSDAPHKNDPLFNQLPVKNKNYGGLVLTFITNDAKKHIPSMRIHNGTIFDETDKPLFIDGGRELEYWLWGTTNTPLFQKFSLEAMHSFTFRQCMLMGNTVVETHPRQCLMANETILLETYDTPSKEDVLVKSFDECLLQGRAIIDSFPRRCVASGGKLFAEPPRRPDGQIILPKPEGVN